MFRQLINASGNFFRFVFRDIEKYRRYEGITDKVLENILNRRSVSDFLFYRTYMVVNDEIGLYMMDDDTIGFIFQIQPPPYLGDDVEEDIANFFNINFPKGTAIQFSTFSSRNLDFVVERYQALHECDINVKNKHMLKKIINWRRRFIKKGISKSLIRGQDFRVRNFINLLTVKFPYGTDIDDIINFWYTVRNRFKKMQPKNFGGEQLIAYVQEILNPSWSHWGVFNAKGKTLNKLMVGSDTHIVLDSKEKAFYLSASSEQPWCAKTITIKEPCERLGLFDFQSFFFDPFGEDGNAISSPFFMQLTVVIDDRYRMMEKVQDKVNNNISNLEKIGKLALTNPALKDRFYEAREVAEMLKDGEFPLSAMWSLTIFDTDINKVNKSVDEVIGNFGKRQFILQIEHIATISFQSLLFSLPLQYNSITREHLKRFDLLFKSNNAQICPILSDFKGAGDIIVPFFGRTAQIQAINLFDNRAGNALVIGQTGTGKSFVVADFIAHYLAANTKVVVADLGENYANLNNLLGGQIIDFEPSKKLCLNFFTKAVCKIDESTGEFILDEFGRKIIDLEELISITQIIGMMIGINLKKPDNADEDSESESLRAYIASVIQEAIQQAFKMKQHNTNLQDVYDIIKMYYDNILHTQPANAEIIARCLKAMEPYATPSGIYYSFFNGVNNINFEADFFILELNRLKQLEDLFYIAYMAVMNFVAAEFFMDRSRRKLFIQEEAWAVLDKYIIATFLEDLYRRIRKYNGAVIIVTNSMSDFTHNVRTKAMFENAPWKFFTEIDPSALEQATEEKTVYLTDLEKEIMKSIKKSNEYSEVMIKSGSSFCVSRVIVDPYSKYLYANAQKDTKQILEPMKAYNLSKQDAILFAALKEETGLPDEAILARIAEENRDNQDAQKSD